MIYRCVKANRLISTTVFFIGLVRLSHGLVPLENENIRNAVTLWVINRAAAEAEFGHISDWDTSLVTDMSSLFSFAWDFNDDISSWTTNAVTDMTYMFNRASKFNRGLSGWNTSQVTSMANMFFGAEKFNGDISEWDTASVTSMANMFRSARSFDGDIGRWNTSNVTNMWRMFNGATSFNCDLSQWDIASVRSFYGMFIDAKSFDQEICWEIDRAEVNTNEMFCKSPGSFSPSCISGDFDDATMCSEESKSATNRRKKFVFLGLKKLAFLVVIGLIAIPFLLFLSYDIVQGKLRGRNDASIDNQSVVDTVCDSDSLSHTSVESN